MAAARFVGVGSMRKFRAGRSTALRAIVALTAAALGSVLGIQPAAASGVAYGVGDVFAGVGNGQIKHFSPSGSLLDTLNTGTGCGEDLGMAFDLSDNLYATAAFGGCTSGHVVKFDDHGNLVGPFGSGYSNSTESIAIDGAGNVYVGQPDGTKQVLKFSSAGTALASFSPAPENRGSDWIDLAADQCTLYYTSEGSHIKRFNACGAGQQPDFAALPIAGVPPNSAAYALRIRPNGEVIVATSQEVLRLNSGGTVIQTYPKPVSETGTLFAMNLDADQTSFWTAGYASGNVYKFDIASGALLASFNAGKVGCCLSGLAVFGELRASQPKLILSPASATQVVGTSITLTAHLENVLTPGGNTVTFTITGANPQTGTATTNSSGDATFTYTGTNAGTDTAKAGAAITQPPFVVTSNTSTINWTKAPTKLVYTGATTSDFNDAATLSAVLTDSANNPLSGQTVSFALDGQPPCSGVTDSTGTASCSLAPIEPSGVYTVTASFAGSANYLPSSDSKPFTVTKEETVLTYTGDTNIANGGTAHMSAVLKEDGSAPIAGRTVTFTLGTGLTAQSCSGVTDATGTASCTISPVNQPLGPGTITASFAGDAFYLPASDTRATLQFGFLATGAFVIGDGNAAMGSHVTYWSAQWAKLDTLSGGASPAAFKGFAAKTSEPPACGAGWSTAPGNSSAPPASVPAFMAVIVTSADSQSGSVISGNTPEIVIVQTDPGYAADPGHAGTGTVVAVLCHM